MKCDELKPLMFSIADLAYVDEIRVTNNFQNPHDHAVYKATEVDAAIAELKDIIKNNQSAYYVDLGIVANDCEKLKARINELESIPHTDNSAVIDALETENAELKDENRKHQRALWLARAYRGYDNSILLPSKFMRKVWDYVERKCRAKAEEYK